jgi:tripartite-type tricarboxylate transporter receptor subunit TctC
VVSDGHIACPRFIVPHIWRDFLHLAAGAAALPAVSRVAWAQTYPARPVRFINGSAAGGTADILARLVAQWLAEGLGQPFVVENRPGAGTTLATETVAKGGSRRPDHTSGHAKQRDQRDPA